jgi:hypothetical protein
MINTFIRDVEILDGTGASSRIGVHTHDDFTAVLRPGMAFKLLRGVKR